MDDSATDSQAGGSPRVAEVLEEFRFQKDLADRALAQLHDGDWHARLDPDANSIAVIVKHVAGNLRSRWTDFLSGDGEKEWRDRDGEFEADSDEPAALRDAWERGWQVALDNVAALSDADLGRTVHIRGQPLTAHRALMRSLAHTAEHVGQIVLLAKHAKGAEWRTLSIPKRSARP